QFTVNVIQGPILAPLGGKVEFSSQLSPPQSAEHMEIRWFWNHYTKFNGKDLYGETISKYVEWTELLKDATGEGKVTLRILNVNAAADGWYHCFFKDGDFCDEAIREVKVTATSLEMQILVHPPNTKGLLVECNSRGWFPQPQMEWRDSRGEIILPSSKSHSQDTDKLFNMKMTLLLRWSSYGNITRLLLQSDTSLVSGHTGSLDFNMCDCLPHYLFASQKKSPHFRSTFPVGCHVVGRYDSDPVCSDGLYHHGKWNGKGGNSEGIFLPTDLQVQSQIVAFLRLLGFLQKGPFQSLCLNNWGKKQRPVDFLLIC
ncbi:hypothetical protein E2I00_014282, partial [Balaenoptera physalus]